MKLLKKALLYDIANMAYMIADTGEPLNHTLHRVRDICEEGNIDRVARVLGLAYSNILMTLSPVLATSDFNLNRDLSSRPKDYLISLRSDGDLKHLLTPERKLKIKENCHEYMVSMVLHDWLEMTLPQASDVWKDRAEDAFAALESLVASLRSGASGFFRRKLSPF